MPTVYDNFTMLLYVRSSSFLRRYLCRGARFVLTPARNQVREITAKIVKVNSVETDVWECYFVDKNVSFVEA